jgi:membrane-bound metal-dependent hydrolase YbcI (DUF457 family)
MKWTNHEVMAFAIPLAVTGNVWIAAGSTLFAVLPDSIEGKPDSRYLNHRGKSHDAIVWSLILGVALVAAEACPSALNTINLEVIGLHGSLVYVMWQMAMWGIGSHLLCDSLTIAGVPTGKSRIAFKLFKTGEPFEYVLTYAVLVLAVMLRLEAIKHLI